MGSQAGFPDSRTSLRDSNVPQELSSLLLSYSQHVLPWSLPLQPGLVVSAKISPSPGSLSLTLRFCQNSGVVKSMGLRIPRCESLSIATTS